MKKVCVSDGYWKSKAHQQTLAVEPEIDLFEVS